MALRAAASWNVTLDVREGSMSITCMEAVGFMLCHTETCFIVFVQGHHSCVCVYLVTLRRLQRNIYWSSTVVSA